MELINTDILLAESKAKLAGYAEPQKISYQDGIAYKKSEFRISLYKVRYGYAPHETQHNSRDFCKKMVSIAKTGLVYRWEDVQKMGKDGVNSEFAASGRSSYSIWLYKGGIYCHHFWERRVFVRKYIGVTLPEWIGEWVKMVEKGVDIAKTGTRAVSTNVNTWKDFVVKKVLKNTEALTDAEKDEIFKTIKDPKQYVAHRVRQEIIKQLQYTKMPTNLIQMAIEEMMEDYGKLFKYIKKMSRGDDRIIGIPGHRSRTKDLENDEQISVREARRRGIKYIVNRYRVATRPIDMPNGGGMQARSVHAKRFAKRIGKKYSKVYYNKLKQRVKTKAFNVAKQNLL